MLVGCEVDDLIITGNDASCIARLKKKLQDDYKVKDWERIASFLGLDISYDLTSGILTLDVKSKIGKLFEDHSTINILKILKLHRQPQKTILTSLTVSKRSGIQSITTSVTSMPLSTVLASTWQSLVDLPSLLLSAKLADGCTNLLLLMWLHWNTYYLISCGLGTTSCTIAVRDATSGATSPTVLNKTRLLLTMLARIDTH